MRIKSWSKIEFPWKFEFLLTIESLMQQLVRTIFRFPSLIKCLNDWRATSITVSWTVTQGIIRFLLLLRIKKRLRSHVHLRHLLIVECLLACAMPQQRFNVACWVFFWYGRTILRNLHGWFLHLRRFIRSMSPPSRTCPPTLCWEKCHFRIRHGIVLGHEISEKGIEVDKAR